MAMRASIELPEGGYLPSTSRDKYMSALFDHFKRRSEIIKSSKTGPADEYYTQKDSLGYLSSIHKKRKFWFDKKVAGFDFSTTVAKDFDLIIEAELPQGVLEALVNSVHEANPEEMKQSMQNAYPY